MLFSHHYNLFQAILDQGFEAGPIAISEEVLGDRLTYRGISYRRPTTSENVSSTANGTDGGGTRSSQPQSWVPDATVVLRYRGSCYLK
ncbi:hypothetical protein H6F93_17085 [Leptolyngbya sp. FACHB-671]|uniref:hypothetical protein n=1 Tax=Leptolyngbya sp. FACHB-671 TaxID=2692812 RepID=UPI0016882A9E|nr:hypothetical protein [Leptolyngbya sp. FACHB-671]MBD2069209.1 hypothetical protein [Leptolyngbya sp. FACHB-671]